jgi:hypothetical protein
MNLTLVGTWIAAFLTLSIFSFLYKDNPFYKLAEHIYVGVSAGFWVLYILEFDVRPLLVLRWISETGFERYILIVPALLGAIMLTRWFPRISWVSRYAIAFTVGIGAGLGITGSIHGYIIPQMQGTLLPFTSVDNVILVVGVVTTILYFFFSREHKGVLGGAARVGIIFVMISFGASFGYTVMARISLLIGRIYFLLHDWLHIVN